MAGHDQRVVKVDKLWQLCTQLRVAQVIQSSSSKLGLHCLFIHLTAPGHARDNGHKQQAGDPAEKDFKPIEQAHQMRRTACEKLVK